MLLLVQVSMLVTLNCQNDGAPGLLTCLMTAGSQFPCPSLVEMCPTCRKYNSSHLECAFLSALPGFHAADKSIKYHVLKVVGEVDRRRQDPGPQRVGNVCQLLGIVGGA